MSRPTSRRTSRDTSRSCSRRNSLSALLLVGALTFAACPSYVSGDSSVSTPPATVCPALDFVQSVTKNSGASGVNVKFSNADSNGTSVAWVDFHVSINQPLIEGSASILAPQYNYRLVKQTDDSFALDFPTGQDDVTVGAQDYLNYFFTYCSDFVDCNTVVYNFSPQPSTGAFVEPVLCPAIGFNTTATIVGDTGLAVTFVSTTPNAVVAWVDIHITIISSTINGQFNYRTTQVDASHFVQNLPTTDFVSVPIDAAVTYFFTYCSQQTDCNTDTFTVSREPSTGALISGNAETCPSITYDASFTRSADQTQLTVEFDNTATDHTVAWVDLHVSINTALLADGTGAFSPQYNYRLTNNTVGGFVYTFPGPDGVSVPSTSYLAYFFTYCSERNSDSTHTDCNTVPAIFGAAAAVQSLPAPVVVPSSTGVAVVSTPILVPTPTASSVCPAITVVQSVTAIPGANRVAVVFANGDVNGLTLNWVDFHVSINALLVPGGASATAPQYNYRLSKVGSTFELLFPNGLDDVTIQATDYLNYFFTYCADQIDCNTDVYNFQPQPATGALVVEPLLCPAVNFTQNAAIVGATGLSINFINTDAVRTVAWVDVHVTIVSSSINGQFNYRATKTDDTHFVQNFPTSIDVVTIPIDAVVTYFFTYCSEQTDCNTDLYSVHRAPDTGALISGGEACPVVTHTSIVTRSADDSQLTVIFHPTTVDRTIAFVDLHVSINTALLTDGTGALTPQFNYRLVQNAAGDFGYTFPGADGVTVPATSYLNYFFTYCSQETDCNTAVETFGATQAQSLATQLLAAASLNVTATSSTGVANSTANGVNNTHVSSTGSNSGNYSHINTNGNKNGAAATSASGILVAALAVGSALLAMNN